MPTITFSLNDLCGLVGKKLSVEKIGELLEYAKGDIENINGDELSASIGDTNQPHLWSVEGLARLFKGLLGIKKGLEQINVRHSKDVIFVEEKLKGIRPYIAAFSARGKKVDDYLLKQIIQLQEKFCHSYGMRRQKVAIGVYNYSKIKFPVYYRATNPESIKFIPLDFRREMTQAEVLEQHPTGREYAWILEGFKEYPLLIDSNAEVLSFPPIINSAYSGKVEPGDENLFFEATGTDMESVQLAANVFAYAFAERGFEIYGTKVVYGKKAVVFPAPFKERMKINAAYANDMLGTKFSDSDVKVLLEKMRLGYKKGFALIPDYRRDIMHPADLVEEIAIAHGYEKLPEQPLTNYTIGNTFPIVRFVDKVRELVIGMGYQEVFSPMLTNKNLLYDRMNVEDFGTVEIENPMSETYSVVRTWLLPQLLSMLAQNKGAEYPQRVFEEGLVTTKKDLRDYERIAIVTAHSKADFTEIKQVLDFIMDNLGVKYEIEETIHHAFIQGRVGRVSVNGKGVAYIGEVSPVVLSNLGLNMPVAATEINLTDLFEAMKKCNK